MCSFATETNWLGFGFLRKGENVVVTVVQSLSHVQHFATPWNTAQQTPLYSATSPSLQFWITALSLWRGLCNSMKLWTMPCRTTQDGWVTMKSSDKTRSTGEGNGNPLQYSCLENPVHRMKREIVVSTEKSEREMVCLSEGKRGKPNADGEESLEKDTGLKGRRNWGNKMLEGDDLRETLSGITPRKKENKTQSIKIQKILHVPEFSSFTDSLGCKWKKKS